MKRKQVLFLYFVIISNLYALVKANNASVRYLKPNVPESVELLAGTRYTFHISQVPNNTKFVVFQVHTYQESVDLDLTGDGKFGQKVSGSNVGGVLFVEVNKMLTTYVSCKNDVSALVAAITYTKEAPIPGGCNLEFELEISPFFHLKYDENKIAVAYQYGSYPSKNYEPFQCETLVNRTFLQYDFYEYFLKESFQSEKELFITLKKMMTVPEIIKNGRKVASLNYNHKSQLLFAALFGQGIIYNVIVRNSKDSTFASAAYVPVTTFSCHLDGDKETCSVLNETLSSFHKVFLLIGGCIGLFLCFKGHRFFKTEMFIFGFLVFLLIFYVVVAHASNLQEISLILVAVSCGLVGGIFWLAFWWFIGSPILSVLLVAFVLGFLFASAIFFTPFGDFDTFDNDFNYGITFICFVMIVPVALLSWAQKMNIIANAIIGSYLAIIAISQFVGVSLGYIIAFVLRRATVKGFSEVYTHAPFQLSDIIIMLLWFTLAGSGAFYQIYQERGRHPFPPHPYLQWKNQRNSQEMIPSEDIAAQVDENEPLIRKKLKSFPTRTSQDTNYGALS